MMRKKMDDDLKKFKIIKDKRENDANNVGIVATLDYFCNEDYVNLMIDECKNDSNDYWLFDCACSRYVCSNNMFHT